MEQDSKSRGQLYQATELWLRGEWVQCRKVLSEVKTAHASIELNQLLCEYKESPAKAAAIMKKLTDILVALNIKLYEERPKQPPARERAPKITHEMYYWNIAVLAQSAGARQVGELIVSEGLHFTDGLRTETSLMLIYQMLRTMVGAGRLASCIALVQKQNRLLERVRSTGTEVQTYRLINQVLFSRVLLKLGMLEGTRIMFAMRFPSENKQELDLTLTTQAPPAVHKHLLAAEIEFHAGNYSQATASLSQLLPLADSLKSKELLRSMVDHNLAIVLAHCSKTAAAHLLLRRCLAYFSGKEQAGNSERNNYMNKCMENQVLVGLLGSGSMGGVYETLRACGGSNSFKFNYRKAQVSLMHYQELLSNPNRVLPFKEVHDSYQTTYFHPNQPYFQQKGKNKNPSFTNGRAYYRRYVLPSSDQKREEGKEGKGMEALRTGEWYLREALSCLQKEKSIIVNLQGEEKGLTEQVNEKLYTEYLDFKASILSLLCYVALCQQQWTKAVQTASLYQQFDRQYHLQTKSPFHQQIFYSVLSYKMEAQAELGHILKAYEVTQDIVSNIEYAESAQVTARSTSSEEGGQVFVQSMSQYANFCYNISVLHSRDNKIPESFQAIQKILQLMRVSPSSPQARLPLSMLELLVHYNLRTGNAASGLQLLKRRRILNAPVIAQYQAILGITK